MRQIGGSQMTWTAPVIVEICVGMEVTSYESAEI
ncbi:MAG TPA: pyrroloquinoline quinone precursor peptide PqqA [Methylocystis sp.]|nr:pyrroloquinoline quinone precursor peptide PqqA [Methylocystis sp.]